VTKVEAPAAGQKPAAAADPGEALDRRNGWLLFAGSFVTLLLTERAAGFTRDESQYFSAGENHGHWLRQLLTHPTEAFSDAAITQAFEYNHEHPALMKNLFGLSYLIFHDALGLMRPATADRIPAFLIASMILPLIYALARPFVGRIAAAFAAISFMVVPRQFFHMHLSCFDIPVAAMWLLVIFCYAKSQGAMPSSKARPWWLYTGLAFGGAIATKHNAFFLPFVLIPFSLWRGWKASKDSPEARSLYFQINGVYIALALAYGVLVVSMGSQRFLATFLALSPHLFIFVAASVGGAYLLWQLKRVHGATFEALAPLVAMAVLGPVIFYAHWPYLWFHPVDRTAWYMAFHAQHNHYTWFYLGELLRAPPFPLSYVVVVTALTVPTAIFVPMCAGLLGTLWRAVKLKANLLEGLIAVNAIASIAIISQPDVPHFGGVKHWFPSMPFLAVLAGISLERGAKALSQRWPKLKEDFAVGGLAALCSVSGIIATARVYPYGTSAYSEMAGGLPGAATLGMQRQFWANNVTGVLDWINQNARPGERVYLHECHGGQIHDYQRNGMVRTDLVFVGDANAADIVAYQYHQEFRQHELMAWNAFGSWKPVTGLYVDETPQIVVYRRK
jgi:4-amino-4-deoxy-L-arabinose transferase-like glycosyltransferase